MGLRDGTKTMATIDAFTLALTGMRAVIGTGPGFAGMWDKGDGCGANYQLDGTGWGDGYGPGDGEGGGAGAGHGNSAGGGWGVEGASNGDGWGIREIY